MGGGEECSIGLGCGEAVFFRMGIVGWALPLCAQTELWICGRKDLHRKGEWI